MKKGKAMLKERKSLWIIALFIFLASCSENKNPSKFDILRIGEKSDKTIRTALPSSIDEGIKCSSYGPNCLSAHIFVIKKLEAIFVEFQNEESAKFVAEQLNAFYYKNWVFDDVAGEPILENFVTNVYKAKRMGSLTKRNIKVKIN